MQRSSGVLMHISSLWGEYSEGSFGAEAREWVDRLAAAGFGVWQVLPFCLPDEYASPYKSYGVCCRASASSPGVSSPCAASAGRSMKYGLRLNAPYDL